MNLQKLTLTTLILFLLSTGVVLAQDKGAQPNASSQGNPATVNQNQQTVKSVPKTEPDNSGKQELKTKENAGFWDGFFDIKASHLLALLTAVISGAVVRKFLVDKHKAEIEKLNAKTEGLQSKHQAEVTDRNGEIDRQKTRIETLEQQSVSKATETINHFKEYAQTVETLLESSKLENEEKNRINEELNRELKRYREEVGDVERLIELLRSDSVEVRRNAANALREFGEQAKPAVSTLTELLKTDDDKWVRVNAAEALGDIGDSSAVPVLIKTLMEGLFEREGEDLCCAASSALGQIDEPAKEAVPTLIEALRNEDPEDYVFQRVIDALRDIGKGGKLGKYTKEIVYALIEVIETQSLDPLFSNEICNVLEEIGTREALQAAKKYTNMNFV